MLAGPSTARCASAPAKRAFGACGNGRPQGRASAGDTGPAGDDAGLALFDTLAARLRANPGAFPSTAALARAAGLARAPLDALIRRHAHLTPSAWLARARVEAAAGRLLSGRARNAAIADAVGFAAESVLERQFLTLTRMTPDAYRKLADTTAFVLRLPRGYRAEEVLAYHGRDPHSPCEQVQGRRIRKALTTPDGPAALEISLTARSASCRVHAARRLGTHGMRALHTSALRMLGLTVDVAAFEARARRDAPLAALVARRPGLRLPMTPTAFEGLCWAIIGQQINLAFAGALRRDVITLAGEPVAGLRAHPTPARLAGLEPAELRKRRFSRSKADYLLGAASAAAAGQLDTEALPGGSAVAAERRLRALHGIGPWTANYLLMRGAGFADCAPAGDVALAAALKNVTAAEARPGAREVKALMLPFSPYRSLATCHLWASLTDTAR